LRRVGVAVGRPGRCVRIRCELSGLSGPSFRFQPRGESAADGEDGTHRVRAEHVAVVVGG